MILVNFKDQILRFSWKAVCSISRQTDAEKTVVHLLSGETITTPADPRVIAHCLKLDARHENPWEQEFDIGRYGIDQHGQVTEDVAGD